MKYKILLPVTNNISYVLRTAKLLEGHESNSIIVNNWTDPMVHTACQAFCDRGAEVYDCRFNLGLAATWNLGISRMVEDDNDFIVILSPSVIFNVPIQNFIDAIIESEIKDPNRVGLYVNDDIVNLHCFARTRFGHEQIGYYDENFWPIYYEDTDLCYRGKLQQQANPSLPFTRKQLHLDIVTSGYSHSCSNSPELLRLYQMNGTRHSLYFLKKWGGPPASEIFLTPFNNPAIKPNDWEIEKPFENPADTHRPFTKYQRLIK